MNYCPECGTKVESDWKNCPFCGFNLLDEEMPAPIIRPQPRIAPQPISQPIPYPQQLKKPDSNTYGIVALIFGILGLCFLPLVGPIIAIVFGNIGKKKDDNPSLANIGFVLGFLGLCCCCCLFILPFLLLPMSFL